VRLQAELGDRSGQLVLEVERVSKGFGPIRVVSDLTMRIMRGDRVGLIGPNGSGKTTMLRLLLGELAPDAGEVRRGANVQIAYYDQQREQLDPERTVFDTVADGHDMVTMNGQPKHVHGYLRDFLFSAERVASPVKALSGGERNRLLLARLFTRPANLLVLDEPTNDLDIETLELLEALLVDWPGTLLLVSHDRAFIDHVVTSTLVFEGEGRVQEYVGGYTDWIRQRRHPEPAKPVAHSSTAAQPPGPSTPLSPPPRQARKKPSFKEQQELDRLPKEIDEMELEQQRLNTVVAGADFYKESAQTIHETLARLDSLQQELLDAYARWDELETRAKG
jgi:ATP-binding cassette subfamily F protein uup